MKITIEYNEDETDDARLALDGYKWKLAMWDLDQLLRSVVKYNASILNPNGQSTGDEVEVADKVREEIRKILEDYNLSLVD